MEQFTILLESYNTVGNIFRFVVPGYRSHLCYGENLFDMNINFVTVRQSEGGTR